MEGRNRPTGRAASAIGRGPANVANAVGVPVFIGVGERDVCPDPRAKPRAYGNSPDITVCIVPRMAHMHNFAGTREVLWARLEYWTRGIAASGDATRLEEGRS